MNDDPYLNKYAILLNTGILAESQIQEGPMLFSSAAGASAELRLRPRGPGAVIVPVILFRGAPLENKS